MPVWLQIILAIFAAFGGLKGVQQIIKWIKASNSRKLNATNTTCEQFEARMEKFIATYGDNIEEIVRSYHLIQTLQVDNLKKENEIALLRESIEQLTKKSAEQDVKIQEQYLLISELKGIVKAYTCERLDCPNRINHAKF